MNYRFSPVSISWSFVVLMPFIVAYFIWQCFMIIFPITEKKLIEMNEISAKIIFPLEQLFPVIVESRHTETKNASTASFQEIYIKGLYNQENNSFVILQYHNNTFFVTLGEVFQGYSLKKVFSDHAVFEKDSQDFILTMNDLKNKPSSQDIVSTQVSQNRNDIFTVNRQEMLRLVKNPSNIINEIQLVPYMKGEQLNGYQIMSIKKDSFFNKIGLEKNDIIKHINNISLNNEADLLYLYNSLETLSTIHLAITRNAQSKDLNYEIH